MQRPHDLEFTEMHGRSLRDVLIQIVDVDEVVYSSSAPQRPQVAAASGAASAGLGSPLSTG